MHASVRQVARISFVFGLFGLLLLASSYTSSALNAIDDDQAGVETWSQGRTLVAFQPVAKFTKIFGLLHGASMRMLSIYFQGGVLLQASVFFFFIIKPAANTRAPPRGFSRLSIYLN